MFAQIITMKVSPGDIEKLRRLIAEEYLPEVSNRPGFVSAGLLEQVDDRQNHRGVAQLVEHPSPKRRVGGSSPSFPARTPAAANE